jgi:DNA repair protein RadC
METTKKIKEFSINEITTSYKRAFQVSDRPKITTPESLYELLKNYEPLMDLISYREMFLVVYTNNSNTILSIQRVGEGGFTATTVDLRIIIQSALMQCATGLFIVHNHPSGNLKASKADKDITKQIKDAANFFNIKLLDHLIVTNENFYSFMENDLLY